MRRAPTAKLRAYLLLASAAMIAGISLGRPELVALGAPFAAYVAIGIAFDSPSRLEVGFGGWRDRLLEGDEFSGTLRVQTGPAAERLYLELVPGAGVVPVDGRWCQVIRLGTGETRELPIGFTAERWGARRLGSLRYRAHDRFGLIEYSYPPIDLGVARVFPREDTLRELISPLQEQATTGSRVSRQRGEGIEFADIRPFASGDRIRRINWRVAARRGTPYITERHPERNGDVILFLDTFAEVRDASRGTLHLAVRAAASLAAGYLARRDRVGVVGFGGALTGLGPKFGRVQQYQILDALIGSEIVFSYADKDVRFVPRRMLPPRALVIAITPLVDERFIGALVDLRARGFDLAVLDVSPVPFAPPGPTASDVLAHRLWLLRRVALASRLQELGVPVTEWRGDQPLQVPIISAAVLRRRSRRRAA
ncbi:MAG: DUF58 domain-containing protein [Solirubrobacteraceae bacterium]